MTYPPEQIEARVESLPAPIRAALFSVESYETLKAVREKFHLTEEQAGDLGSATGHVFMGFVPPREFASHLAESLKTDQGIAANIAREIDASLFAPIKEDLLRLNLEAPKSGGSVPLQHNTHLPPPPAPPPAARRILPTRSIVSPQTPRYGFDQSSVNRPGLAKSKQTNIGVNAGNLPKPAPRERTPETGPRTAISPPQRADTGNQIPVPGNQKPFSSPRTPVNGQRFPGGTPPSNLPVAAEKHDLAKFAPPPLSKKSPFNTPTGPSEKKPFTISRGIEEGNTFRASPPPKPGTKPVSADSIEDILAAKLSSPIASENTAHNIGREPAPQSHYNVDPYREPPE